MNAETLYLATIDDAKRLLAESIAYATIRAGALLRQLLLDGANSLVDRVNKQPRIKLGFTAQRPIFLPVRNFQVWNISVRMPSGLPYVGQPPIALNRDKFLNYVVAAGEGEQFRVRDMIAFCANVAGGVHYGDAHTAKENLLLRMHEESLKAGEATLSLLLRGIRDLVEVVVDGLEPLTEAVIAQS